MKKLILLGFLLFTNYFAFGQNAYQYFDGADTICDPFLYDQSICIELDSSSNNIWQIGRPQKQLFDSAATFPNALMTDTLNYYPVNNSSSVQFFIYPQQTWGVLAIQWKQKLDIDSFYDGGTIEFSVDTGQTWQNAFNNPYVYNFYGFDNANVDTLNSGMVGFSGTDSTWRDIWLCYDLTWLHNPPNVPNILIRFTFESDSIDNQKEGWMIDNLISHMTILHTLRKEPSQEGFKVYPNPTTDILYIEAEKVMGPHIIEEMTLTNILGQELDRWKRIPTKFFIDTQKYPSGNYYLKIKTNIESRTIPIVIQKK